MDDGEPLGAGRDAVGAGRDAVGAGRDAVGAGRDAVGAGRDVGGGAPGPGGADGPPEGGRGPPQGDDPLEGSQEPAAGRGPHVGAFEPAVEVTRSGDVESIHYASAAMVDRKGRLQGFLGDPHRRVVLRSAMKFMQALPFFEEGLHERYGLTAEEQAVTMGSHSGQDFHVNAVLSILGKAGIPAGALKCGRHRPFHRGTARELGSGYSDLHNGCSAKHAMMLATCRALDMDLDSYLEFDHPLQERIRGIIARLAGLPGEEVVPVVDGCNLPTFTVPLASMARTYAVLASCWSMEHRGKPGRESMLDEPDDDDPVRTLPEGWVPTLAYMAQLHLDHPVMIGGDDRLDTDLMLAANMEGPSLICKVGGEAVHGTSILENGWGLAVKASDGEFRPLGTLIVEILEQAGLYEGMLSQDGETRAKQVELFKRWKHPVVRTHTRQEVGHLRPCFRLRRRVSREVLREQGIKLPFDDD